MTTAALENERFQLRKLEKQYIIDSFAGEMLSLVVSLTYKWVAEYKCTSEYMKW